MHRLTTPLGILGLTVLAGCAGGTSSGTAAVPAQIPAQGTAFAPQSIDESVDATAPFVIHVGFKHAAIKDPTYGPVAFYAPNTGPTAVIKVKSGSKVVFLNDDTTRHTASGLGTSGFPTSFDNTSGLKAVGKTINGGLTWATGSLNPGAKSKPFTVGPKGTYYFGCYYHYHVTPAMRDVLVSQ